MCRSAFLNGPMDREDEGRRIRMGKAEAPELKMRVLQGLFWWLHQAPLTPLGIAFHALPFQLASKGVLRRSRLREKIIQFLLRGSLFFWTRKASLP
jgi:hypothetical protein